MPSTHMGYTVPSGMHDLVFDTNAVAPLNRLRFIFGGSLRFQILSVIGWEPTNPRIEFQDATAHEATVFFARNNLENVGSTGFVITVKNNSSSDEQLQVTALYE